MMYSFPAFAGCCRNQQVRENDFRTNVRSPWYEGNALSAFCFCEIQLGEIFKFVRYMNYTVAVCICIYLYVYIWFSFCTAVVLII